MDPDKVILYLVVTIVGTIVIVACVRLIWLALGGVVLPPEGDPSA